MKLISRNDNKVIPIRRFQYGGPYSALVWQGRGDEVTAMNNNMASGALFSALKEAVLRMINGSHEPKVRQTRVPVRKKPKLIRKKPKPKKLNVPNPLEGALNSKKIRFASDENLNDGRYDKFIVPADDNLYSNISLNRISKQPVDIVMPKPSLERVNQTPTDIVLNPTPVYIKPKEEPIEEESIKKEPFRNVALNL